MSEISITGVCCTCLSTDRKLRQLCRIPDGINLLYMLLSVDPEAYKDGFYKDVASLLVCWECSAVMYKIKRFQAQACITQKQLTAIADGQDNIKFESLSRLTNTFHAAHYEFQSSEIIAENFIDCGPIKEIKTESDSDDMPLITFCYENDSDDSGNDNIGPGKNNIDPGEGNIYHGKDDIDPGKDNTEIGKDYIEHVNDNTKHCKGNMEHGKDNTEPGNATKTGKLPIAYKRKYIKSELENITTVLNKDLQKGATSKKKTKMKYSKYFLISIMDEEGMLKSVEERKKDMNNTVFKCDDCLIEFKTENVLFNHKDLHKEKDNYSQCEICHIYTGELDAHKQTHYHCYNCMLCTYTSYTHVDIVRHLKKKHREMCKKKASKRKLNGTLLNDISKYPCAECDLNFQNKDLRWKHVQKAHREGYKCISCDKKFAFKNNLERHERIHQAPLPREECPTCHKLIRVDLVKTHSRIHSHRQRFTCVECDKSFVSRATYETHLKYARPHATVDVCRHSCPSCPKRYRSGGELRDHINYNHKGQAEHKCPICGKGLATKRCIRRHVRRTHEGIKENAKDKICQQCGRAFRDKKTLIEHERVHSGARPLTCGACGRAFRQRAALTAHTARLHRTV